MQNDELNDRILKLEHDYSQKMPTYDSNERLAETERIINMYKNKLDEKNHENDRLRGQNEELKNQMHGLKIQRSEI